MPRNRDFDGECKFSDLLRDEIPVHDAVAFRSCIIIREPDRYVILDRNRAESGEGVVGSVAEWEPGEYTEEELDLFLDKVDLQIRESEIGVIDTGVELTDGEEPPWSMEKALD